MMRTAEDLEAQGSPAKRFITVCVLLILTVGGGIFLVLHLRSKLHAITPEIVFGGYERVDTNGTSTPTVSAFGEYSEQFIEKDDEESDDDDIVYMTKDGTVYRKFKYGLLDEDEIELEYDDESYSYR